MVVQVVVIVSSSHRDTRRSSLVRRRPSFVVRLTAFLHNSTAYTTHVNSTRLAGHPPLLMLLLQVVSQLQASLDRPGPAGLGLKVILFGPKL